MQEPDDLARPHRDEEVRVRGLPATPNAVIDCRGRVGLTNDGVQGGWINQARVLGRHRFGTNHGDGLSIGADRISHENLLHGQHFVPTRLGGALPPSDILHTGVIDTPRRSICQEVFRN